MSTSQGTETLEKEIDEMPSEEAVLVSSVKDEPEPLDFPDEAAVLSDNPRRELRIGWIIAIAFFGVVVGYSLFARMDAAVYAPGAIAVSGNRQAVQHRDGGTISGLHVREGQRVNAGDILIELAPADVGAQVESLEGQWIGLQARRARLYSEATGAPMLIPAEFAALTGKAKAEADRAFALQRTEYGARRTSLVQQKLVLGQRVNQLNKQIEGVRGQLASTDDQRRLLADQLTGLRTLAERGFTAQNTVRQMERNDAELVGQKANLTANEGQAREQIGEMQSQSKGLDSDYAEKVAQELREVETSLADVNPRLVAMRDRLAGTAIRAPATGQVVGLTAFTVGGVIAPGQTVAEIVPDAAPLVIEAQVSPLDADDIHVGQPSEVRVTALHDRNLGPLKGEVTRVSADRLVDQKSGNSYFTAQVTVPATEFAKVKTLEGADKSLRAGLPVEILIPLKKRTAFEYMMEPLTQALWRSFREH